MGGLVDWRQISAGEPVWCCPSFWGALPADSRPNVTTCILSLLRYMCLLRIRLPHHGRHDCLYMVTEHEEFVYEFFAVVDTVFSTSPLLSLLRHLQTSCPAPYSDPANTSSLTVLREPSSDPTIPLIYLTIPGMGLLSLRISVT